MSAAVAQYILYVVVLVLLGIPLGTYIGKVMNVTFEGFNAV